MWSSNPARRFGQSPMRRITLFVSAILMALFAATIFSSTPLQAQTTPTIPGEGTWSGQNISLDGITATRYSRPDANDENFPDLYRSPCENRDFLYYSPTIEPPSDPNKYWIYVICLPEGNDGSDTSQSVEATLMIFMHDRSGGVPKAIDFKERSDNRIRIVAANTNTNSDTSSGEYSTSCSSEHTHGMGWLICPVTRVLSAGMDQLYQILSDFLTVNTLTNDTNSTLFSTWGLVRNIANILFIIGFIIIIYSQITSYNISNYGLKRLLPRVIIAAILVNLSYWICAVLVDLSNILGVYIREAMKSVVGTIEINGNVAFEAITWEQLAGFALTGAVGSAMIAGVAISFVASAGASLWFLLVTLAGVMVSALVAILVLAARQALITILIVVSPLAFVAYILPSTEKYFDKWREIFSTMLLLFPIFSLIFGGSQLAGLLIIAGALENQSKNSLNMIILGMAVQVAPIIITPLLIKFSGALLGRIAGIVNNPNKGFIDSTRNFAQRRHDLAKNSRMWDWDSQNKRYRSRSPLAAGARRMALREANSTNRIKALESGLDAAYEQTAGAHKVYEQSAINKMRQSIGEDEAKTLFERKVSEVDNVRRVFYEQQINRERADAASKENTTRFEGLKAEPYAVAVNSLERQLGIEAKETADRARMLTFRENAAHLVQEENVHALIAREADLQKFAGFDEVDPHGAARVASIAQQKEADAYQTRVQSFLQTEMKVEATQEDRLQIAQGLTPTSPFASTIQNHANEIEGRAAAIRFVGEKSPVKDVHFLMRKLNLTETANGNVVESTLRSELADVTKKTVFVSATRRAQIVEGRLDSELRGDLLMDTLIQETLNAGAFSVSGLSSSIDRDDLHEAAEYIKSGKYLDPNAKDQLKENLYVVTHDTRYSANIDKRKKELGELWDAVNGPGSRPANLL